MGIRWADLQFSDDGAQRERWRRYGGLRWWQFSTTTNSQLAEQFETTNPISGVILLKKALFT